MDSDKFRLTFPSVVFSETVTGFVITGNTDDLKLFKSFMLLIASRTGVRGATSKKKRIKNKVLRKYLIDKITRDL